MLPEYLENNRTRVFLKHENNISIMSSEILHRNNSYQLLLFQASYQLFHYVIGYNGTWNKNHLALFVL
jgi:hypothetical protein